jgi:hypothetical protein
MKFMNVLIAQNQEQGSVAIAANISVLNTILGELTDMEQK